MIHLTGHTGTVRSVAYSPGGTLLASGGKDHTVCLWDLAARRALAVLKAGDSSVESVAFSPDGQTVAAGCADGVIWLWAVSDGRVKKTLRGHGPFGVRAVLFVAKDSVTFTPTDRGRVERRSGPGVTLASAGWDGFVRFWDVGSGEQRTFITDTGRPVTALACPPDGRWFALGFAHTGRVPLWSPGGIGYDATLEGHDRGVLAAAASPDGGILATADNGGTIKLWDVAARARRASWPGHPRVIYALAFTPDGATLLSGGADAAVKLWDSGGRLKGAFHWEHCWVTSLALAPDGMTAAAAGAGPSVVVWDVEAGSG